MSKNLPATIEKFPPGLAYDVAMNATSVTGTALFDDEDLSALYGYTQEELDKIKIDPEFRIAVRAAMHELKESGDTVRIKMRQQFEAYLDTTVPQMMSDVDVSPKDKVAILLMLGKGGLVLDDSKGKQETQQPGNTPTNQPSFTLILQTAPEKSEPKVITIEQEKD